MVMRNWLELQNGVPARLHFADHHEDTPTLTDVNTGAPTRRNRLVMDVDSLNGRAVVTQLSILADKLKAMIEPYLPDKAYRNYDFVLTQTGDGYQRRWSLQVIPRPR